MRYILNYKDFITENVNVEKINFTQNINKFITEFSSDKKIEDKLKSLIVKYILNDIYPNIKNDVSADDRKIYNGLNSYQKIDFLCDNYRSLINVRIDAKLASIQDYFLDNNTDINIVRSVKTFNELYELSVMYHDSLTVSYKNVREDETSDTDKFIVYPNGWYWINLNVEYSEDEAENMGHCGRDAGKILFSLRDDKKQSHITASYSPTEKALYQIKGRKNSKPKNEYHEKIIDMILNDKYEVKFMKTCNYRSDLDFSLNDISEERRNKLYKSKPSLMLTDKMFEKYFKSKDYIGILSMINNGYSRYTGSDISLYYSTYDWQEFKKDCIEQKIDYTKLLKYCFSLRDALVKGHLGMVKILIKAGADVTFNLNYAIGYASENGYFEIVELLIEHGADVTSNENYSIKYASENGHLEIVRLLIENGADVSDALKYASENGHLEIVKLLIEHGADVTVAKNHALRMASKYGYLEIVKLLIEHGADVTCVANHALSLASENGHLEIVKLLIEHGADVTDDNNTAIKHASRNGYTEIVELLKKHGAML